jgi:peptide/nickel transport system substrate-binding protein
MAESGEADISLTLSATAAERLQKTSGVSIISTAIPRVRLLKLNANLDFFDTIEERLALSLAIDRAGIAKAILKNPKTSAIQLMPEVSLWHNTRLKPLVYNPKKACRLLEKAGWKKNEAGIYAKGSKEFSFELITYSSRPMLPVVAEALQSQFAVVGIRMKISVGKSSQIPARHKDGTIETALLGRNFGLVPDSVGTINADFGPVDSRGSWGALGWESSKLNKLIDKYLNAFNEKKASKIRKKITDVLQEELPVIPVSWYDHHVAVSKDITGVKLDAFELRPYPEGVQWAK